METVKKRLQQYLTGVITLEEFRTLIDKAGIRGAIRNNNGFIGYDYNKQEWIEF